MKPTTITLPLLKQLLEKEGCTEALIEDNILSCAHGPVPVEAYVFSPQVGGAELRCLIKFKDVDTNFLGALLEYVNAVNIGLTFGICSILESENPGEVIVICRYPLADTVPLTAEQLAEKIPLGLSTLDTFYELSARFASGTPLEELI